MDPDGVWIPLWPTKAAHKLVGILLPPKAEVFGNDAQAVSEGAWVPTRQATGKGVLDERFQLACTTE